MFKKMKELLVPFRKVCDKCTGEQRLVELSIGDMVYFYPDDFKDVSNDLYMPKELGRVYGIVVGVYKEEGIGSSVVVYTHHRDYLFESDDFKKGKIVKSTPLISGK